ncbi:MULTISPECIES: ABC transporter permease [Bacillus cereus group]|uniref:ABC transporter permease n=1 Tax=Bacillus cereus TaxID=1396 RepID=A0AA44Q9J1_BACCE|nr:MULTISPECIES: ABC transporter permease [Bacillus cereus group]EEL49090.1 Sodium export permease protein [Bacillus cereus Rock3-44]PFA20917.1 ABC transporter permease [Bacillus cereus]PFN04946.1 ABC transporter permease [Bacillus cereus]PFO82156.1 ABC transporter permease [Bacillus cereus]PFR27972.1 ABC transporter permease [Bacillus cereus]
MRKFSHVFSFYFRESFLSKKTLITSGILFLIVFGVFAFNHFTADGEGSKDKDKIAIVVETSTYKVQEDELNKLLPAAKVKVSKQAEYEKLHKQVEEGDLDALFHITEKNGVPEVKYIYSGFPSEVESTVITKYLKQQYTQITITNNNVSPDVAQKLQVEIPLKEEAIKDRASIFGIGYLFTFILYMFILMYGNAIGTSIASEKASRVMEVMIPKVKPIILMYAKVLATIATALAQLLIAACGFLIPYAIGWIDFDNSGMFGLFLNFEALNPFVISMFLIYFVAGYLLYAMLYAAVGAVVSKTEDLQTVATPIIFLAMGALFISIQALTDPNSTLVLISSYIPFFTPMVTFSRIVAGEAGAIEISTTLAILVVTIVIINWIASRIYVNGVMNYSDKVKFKDLAKFMKRQ